MNMTHASQYGKGAIRTPQALASTRFRLAAPVTAPAINWDIPYDVETKNNYIIPQLDQKLSFSCTYQSTVYYGKSIGSSRGIDLDKQYSRRHGYSQVYVPPEGGAYIWKAMSIPVKQGYVLLESVPDGDST